MSGKRIDISEEVLRDLYWNQGLSTVVIAKMYGCTRATIRMRMIKYGIPRRPRELVHVSKETLIDLYLTKRLSAITVAKIVGCSNSTVHVRLIEYGIPVRNRSEARTGHKTPVVVREKISAAQRCDKGHNFGKHLPKSTCQKMSVSRSGEKGSFYGKHHSESALRKNRDAHLGRHHSDDTKEKLSLLSAGENNPMYGMSGEKSPVWRGGTSFEPYCHKFNEAFKESIRDKFGRVCFLCPTTEEENGRKLCVHHVNYNKDCLCSDADCEFVPLCDSCHSKTNHNRDYWEEIILNKLKEKNRSQ